MAKKLESKPTLGDDAASDAVQRTELFDSSHDGSGRDGAQTSDAVVSERPAKGHPLPRPRRAGSRKLYQDELYGSKELSPLASVLIDTPEFQRLAHIYQLGFTYTTFRGANHRRFDHSVGTYFVSRLLMRRVVQNHARLSSEDGDPLPHPGLWLSPRLELAAPGTPAQAQMSGSAMSLWRGLVEVVSAAALLHDLGHVAVGHTLEDEFSIYEKHDGLGGARLFQLLYGPRSSAPDPQAIGTLGKHFGSIDEERLPRPKSYDLRTPLPWVFEEGMYSRFLPAGNSLTNPEIRDLIYLILSYKETVTDDNYLTFEEELAHAEAESRGPRVARLQFLSALYRRWSDGGNSEERPLFHPFMSDIVGNTICADLLDYLVRDGRRLALDIRNNPRLQRYLIIRQESSFVNPSKQEPRDFTPSTLRLTINAVTPRGLPRRDTVSDLLDLMRERYHFAEVVYYHPKKAAFSAMLAKSIEMTPANLRPRDDENIYPPPWTTDALNLTPHVTHLGDDSLLSYLSTQVGRENSGVAGLARRILYRDEYRLLFTLDYEGAEDAGGGPLKFIRDLRGKNNSGEPDAGRRRWESTFHNLAMKSPLNARLHGREPAALIYCPNIRMQAKEVAARVELKAGRVIPLNRQKTETGLAEEIRILNNEYRALWRLYLLVHPNLMMPDADEWVEFQRTAALNTLVDRFCDYYGVTERFRLRGTRMGYISWNERVNRYFGDWRSSGRISGILRSASGAIVERIEDIARDHRVWQASDADGGTPIPVTREEYASGFALATCLAAASACPPERKGDWPEPLQIGSPIDWIKHSDVQSLDSIHRSQVSRLVSVGNSMNVPSHHRNRPATWDDFCEVVWNDISGGAR